jgi:hypothetical protein
LGEAIEDCSTDLELGYLTLECARDDALTEQLEAVHFRFDEAAAMIAAPLLPDVRPSRLIARSVSLRAFMRAILLPGASIAADRK